MRLATLDDGTRDGHLAVVSPCGTRLLPTPRRSTLQGALEDWARASPELEALDQRLAREADAGLPVADERLLAPLPRAYEWLDGSTFLTHVRLARQARGAPVPATLESDPLVYQGGSGSLLGPREPFLVPRGLEDANLDFEAELCCAVSDLPMAAPASECRAAIRLLLLANDWTYRGLVPTELAKGFGFVVSKPTTGFAPFAVTPDHLGQAWRDGRAHLHIRCSVNDELVGDVPSGPDMHFSFDALLAHIVRTRTLVAGTLVGSGTVSSSDPQAGSACLVERRWREILSTGTAQTPFLKAGDRVRLEGRLGETNLFGTLEQGVMLR